MAATKFERLFNNWEDDADITMVDLGTTGKSSKASPGAPTDNYDAQSIPPAISRRGTQEMSSLRSPQDPPSTASLLHPTSYATTTDYQSSNALSDFDDTVDTRQRQGFKSKIGPRVQQLWRRKPKHDLPQLTGTTFVGNFAHGKPGWWHKQMLVDRSLRTMAAFTAVCAIVMLIIVLCYAPAFSRRANKGSTSVGGSGGESCHTAESRNVAIHLFVNIAATMILGCSNTYQQLVTALKVQEIPWVLSKRGDSRVGTNSPWSINHRKDGKTTAWLCWLLLISTSVPIHFLANSVIGPSFYISMPTTVSYVEQRAPIGDPLSPPPRDDSACWTALRAKHYALPADLSQLVSAYGILKLGTAQTFDKVEVIHTPNCTSLVNTGTIEQALKEFVPFRYGILYESGSCHLGRDAFCRLSNESHKSCRMNVRMQAAIILARCLFLKSFYMIYHNFRARHKVKDRCLTFGDIIVASVLDPELKIQNECMVNSGDGFRQSVTHTCHKHCKDPITSATGDTIGHCQKCLKFNIKDRSAGLLHPCIAIKYKRSLLSNLGSTAITQMLLLMVITFLLVGVSILLLIFFAKSSRFYDAACRNPDEDSAEFVSRNFCETSKSKYMAETYGTWGGFSSSATLSSLPADSLSSEFQAFAISNGAQFIYSLLYMLLIYNLSLISMEHEWGRWELKRRRPRCTIVAGEQFEQSYFLQLPSKIIIPLMAYASVMHWLLGQAISTAEIIYTDDVQHTQHTLYYITYAAYPIFISTILMVGMTAVCWWAFTYRREGFIPQMYGSIRTCCASTTELTDFTVDGIQWGDLGEGEHLRHAGFTNDEPSKIVPAELYCGR